ncbi:MAG: dipeptide epimerase [Candidatus Melainabacteria bacterium]|nr:dipeptide epimerase [Candidatus Melainabacteria bacterium]
MSNVTLTARPFNLRLRYPFGISRGTLHIANNVLVTLYFGDYIAYGEAAPSGFYGENQKSVIEFIKAFSKNRTFDKYLTNINSLKEDLDSFNLNISQQLRSSIFSYSARVCLEMAFWDLIGKIQKRPLCEFFFPGNPFALKQGLSKIKPTSFTIGLDKISMIKEKVEEAKNKEFSILKIKLGLGFDEDLNILDTIKNEMNGYSYTLRVDANGGWSVETTKKMLDYLPKYNVEVLEQPLHRGRFNELVKLKGITNIPIIVDEDCLTASDIESLAGKVDGINIKLMKSGSIIEALDMISLAKAYNLKVMLGCMIESSCSIAAAAHLSPLVDYVDLDGHLLLAQDPFSGLSLEDSRVIPSMEDGLGVTYTEK